MELRPFPVMTIVPFASLSAVVDSWRGVIGYRQLRAAYQTLATGKYIIWVMLASDADVCPRLRNHRD